MDYLNEVREAIKDGLEQGKSPKEIKELMRKAGYSESEISAAFSAETAPRSGPDSKESPTTASSAQEAPVGVHAFAILSIVFGIVGFFLFGIILSPLAIVFGFLGLRKGSPNKIISIIGVVMGVVGLVIIILVIFTLFQQMAVFTPSTSISANSAGFSLLKPVEWACDATSGDLTINFVNGAGGQITNVAIGGVPCSPDAVAAGDITTCRIQRAQGCS